MSPLPDDLSRGCRNAQLLGIQLILCVGIYGYVLETIRTVYAPFTGFFPVPRLDLLRIVLAAMAVANLVVIRIIVPKLLAAQASGPEILGMPRASAVVKKLFTVSVVALAMCEAIAIYGLVLFLIAGNRADFYSFAAFSLLAFAIHFPRRSQWEEWAREYVRPSPG
jgi:F0F1-type ATP synthase membrane subunit c/vacuolar-type H+-ATPase subunit K